MATRRSDIRPGDAAVPHPYLPRRTGEVDLSPYDLNRGRSSTATVVARPPAYDSGVATTAMSGTPTGHRGQAVYTAEDAPEELDLPGEFPFTRGPYPHCTAHSVTIRQYRVRIRRGDEPAFPLSPKHGRRALGCVRPADPARLRLRRSARGGEVGRTGVAIDRSPTWSCSSSDSARRVSTSMTTTRPRSCFCCSTSLVAERAGSPCGDQLRGTVQTTSSRSTSRAQHIFPPRLRCASRRNLFAYTAAASRSEPALDLGIPHPRGGLHRGAGARVHARERDRYVEARSRQGFAGRAGERLSFFFQRAQPLFQELAKSVAARRLWRGIMQERFGATNPKRRPLRFHAQTGGSTLRRSSRNNIGARRIGAVGGGRVAQSIHTNAYDEALRCRLSAAHCIALRTQQLLATRPAAPDTADPSAARTSSKRSRTSSRRMPGTDQQIDELGGAVAAC